jgi:PKHD-type hydroxylase|tara:strand:+ start:208 stop:852 length:645 start_codon:yes stop_codon:yes gene_type:complete
MNLVNDFYFFKSVLTPKFCEEVIRYGEQKFNQVALTGNIKLEGRDLNKSPITRKELEELRKVRDSNISWLDDPWIYREILPYVTQANAAAGWNFQLDAAEPFQFTRYGIGQFYDFHCDSFKEPYNKPDQPTHGKIRKLSVACNLSLPENYRGGELEFHWNDVSKSKKVNLYKCKEVAPRGSLVVFPSFVYHKVHPVVEGKRYSLILWNLGDPFK